MSGKDGVASADIKQLCAPRQYLVNERGSLNIYKDDPIWNEGSQMLDQHHYYFPAAESPFFQPFATAFLAMMFAHAEFQARIRELQIVITNDGLAQIAENAVQKFLGNVVRGRDIVHEGKLTRLKPGEMDERLETIFSLPCQHVIAFRLRAVLRSMG